VTDIDTQFEELTIAAFHTALRNGELTAAELVDWYLARIAGAQHGRRELQAVVTVNPQARAEAAARDASFAATGRLSGTTARCARARQGPGRDGRPAHDVRLDPVRRYVPASDATLVTKLRDAGAVILAKTAMCDFAAGWFSSSSLTDHTKNPYDPARESGGSSAGTAAGVAANFGLVGIGEDTGGSIRIPASFNNLFGLRVTTGLISRAGFSPLVHFQDTPGPIGRTVADVATLLDSIVGYDPQDPFTVTASAPPKHRRLRAGARSRRPAGQLADRGAGDGLRLRRRIPTPRRSTARFGRRSPARPNSAWPRPRGSDRRPRRLDRRHLRLRQAIEVRHRRLPRAATRRARVELHGDLRQPAVPPAERPVPRDRRGPDTTDGDAEYLRLRLNQEHFRRLVLNIFAVHRLDFLVYPTVQVLPPTRDELAAEKYQALTFPTNTVIGSQAGLPALTIPVGFTEDGLPVGMELLGTPLAETKLLQFARAWETTERGGQRPPQRRPRFAMVRKDSRLGRCTAESGRTWIKAARCARRGSAPALGLCLGRPGRARADSLPQLTALIALIRHGRECCSPGRRPQVLARGAGYPSGGIVGRAALAVSRPLPSLRPDSQASMAAGGPVTSTGGLVPMCSMP
jgi:amidase